MSFSLCWNLIMVDLVMIEVSSHHSFILAVKFGWVRQKFLNQKGFASLSIGKLMLMMIGQWSKLVVGRILFSICQWPCMMFSDRRYMSSLLAI